MMARARSPCLLAFHVRVGEVYVLLLRDCGEHRIADGFCGMHGQTGPRPDERACLDPRDPFAHVLLEVGERVCPPLGPLASGSIHRPESSSTSTLPAIATSSVDYVQPRSSRRGSITLF